MKFERSDLKTKVTGKYKAIEWKDKQNVNILTKMHSPPSEVISVMCMEKV
jgi:hypothetical protein